MFCGILPEYFFIFMGNVQNFQANIPVYYSLQSVCVRGIESYRSI